jgi:hypothetical protein
MATCAISIVLVSVTWINLRDIAQKYFMDDMDTILSREDAV